MKKKEPASKRYPTARLYREQHAALTEEAKNRSTSIAQVVHEMKTPRQFMEIAFRDLPDFMDVNFPKGENKDRGSVTVGITLFLNHLKHKLYE